MNINHLNKVCYTIKMFFIKRFIASYSFHMAFYAVFFTIINGTINRHRDFSFFLDSGAAFIVTPLL